jgi:diacylglycerol kinase (ATP)
VRSRSLLWSFDYAIRGIVYALRTQRNMRLHALAAAAVVLGALALRITGLELVALIFAIGLVICAELVNTAVEATVDLATDAYDPMAAVAKDVAAGGVLVASLTALGVGYVVFFGRLTPLAQRGLEAARTGAATITFLALVLTLLAMVAVKAVRHERGTSFIRGGWPSGHTGSAVALATGIGYATGSAKAFLAALAIAGLVAQSRIETGAHTIPQTIAGAVLGFLLTTAVFQIFWR